MKNKVIKWDELIRLIRDGQTPKQIKYNGKTYIHKKDHEYCNYFINEGSGEITFNYHIEYKILDENIVEIPLEENDEWEYIEEIKELQFGGDCKYRFASENGTEYEMPKEMVDIINQLIKNQKYLKEMLESKDGK